MRNHRPDGLRQILASTIISLTWWRSLPSRTWSRLNAFRHSPWVRSLVKWLVPVLVLFIILGLCQAIIKLHDRETETSVSAEQQLVDPDYGELRLVATSPRGSRYNLDDLKRVPLSISLLRGTPAQDDPSTQRGIPPKYIVTVSAESGVVEFTNKDGAPVIPQFVMQPSYDASEPAIVYLRPSEAGHSMELTVSVLIAADQPLPGANALRVAIPVEGSWRAVARYLWDKIFEAGVLVILVTAAVNYGIEQWKRIEEENRAQRQQKAARGEAIRTRIEDFTRLVERNPSEGARRYLDYKNPDKIVDVDPVLRESLFGEQLAVAWSQAAPPDLSRVCELQQMNIQGKLGQPDSRGDDEDERDKALLHAWYGSLDGDWKQKISDILIKLKLPLPEKEVERLWKAALRPWPLVQAWTPSRYVDPPAVRSGVLFLSQCKRLSQEVNPFFTAPGEMDDLLLKSGVDAPGYDEIIKLEPTLILGDRGAGKTAQALLLVHHCIHTMYAFPVYYPNALAVDADRQSHLNGIAEAITLTLLAQWVAQPALFINQSLEMKARHARLVARYVGTGKLLMLRMREMGCSPLDSSESVLQILQEMTDGIAAADPLEDRELIAALASIRPAGPEPKPQPGQPSSRYPTFVLVDVSSPDTERNPRRAAYQLDPLLALVPSLAEVGIFLKLFFPAALAPYLDAPAPMNRVMLQWSKGELENLMKRRFLRVGEYDEFADLVDVYSVEPRAKLLEYVVNTASGAPGTLFDLGSKLIAQIAAHPDNPVITEEDFFALLPLNHEGPPL